MSYTPTNWQTGDTVTAEKLNNMESGIDNAIGSVEIVTNPCIVNLTPTAQDFSGVMDKTVDEIFNAYEAGRKIVFRVWTSAAEHMDVDCTARWYEPTTYPSFNGFILNNLYDMLILAGTGTTNDGSKNTYSTTLYPLTPMS